MMRLPYFILAILFCLSTSLNAQQRTEKLLTAGWKFSKGETVNAASADFNDKSWESISVPHDWAIKGPFGRDNDLQTTRIVQNGEKVASEKTGRTGGLPYIGIGWYRIHLPLQKLGAKERVFLKFDGAMSNAEVYVNGKKATNWPYGYNAFHTEITNLLRADAPNVLAVRLENKSESSRWYPGAGIYRNVHLIITENVHVPIWGTYITTPSVMPHLASVRVQTKIDGIADDKSEIKLETEIYNDKGEIVASRTTKGGISMASSDQHFLVKQPKLWSPETPNLYKAVSKVYENNKLKDVYETRFGIRKISFDGESGFTLNGVKRKFQGVCNHHDLGPLGAAINEAALRRRLLILKDMGADAIRTAHNMPSPELVKLSDELGIMLIVESFDEWKAPKMKNGYHNYFDQWVEKDLINMIHANRNSPSVVLWSIGNEVPDQGSANGVKLAAWMQDICHREDPTRLVTVGMDRIDAVLKNGFAAVLDLPGFNYKPSRYKEAYEKLPQGFILGSETASTVSSRGIYKFPIKTGADITYPDNQSSSYDMEHCPWSQTPDDEFLAQDDLEYTIGEFVWTGFDYLGEPAPYESSWPSHSSYFGIVDLAGIPKDRYYLYRSRWNTQEKTLHLLPHWTWPGREGETTPVYCYTNYPAAELFVNGKSMGIRKKDDTNKFTRNRLMWNDVKYEPGTIKVIGLDENGKAVAEQSISTAGKPYQINLSVDRKTIKADGKDLAFVTATVVDAKGNVCPTATDELLAKTSGNIKFKTIANGDPTNLQLFHQPRMHAFSGKLVITLEATNIAGGGELIVSAKGLKSGKIKINTEK
ncbi:beta-galactosidase GalB [Pelobium manganitolerans]|nr:beta-galactosidase GalB [Pelobium manganitolerans]